MENSDPLAQLKKMVVSQKTAALPDVPPDPQLQPLHQQIVAYDRHVSEAVIGILSGGSSAQSYPDAQDVQKELDARKPGESGMALSLLEQYQNYKNRLDKMLELALQVASSRSST